MKPTICTKVGCPFLTEVGAWFIYPYAKTKHYECEKDIYDPEDCEVYNEDNNGV